MAEAERSNSKAAAALSDVEGHKKTWEISLHSVLAKSSKQDSLQTGQPRVME